VFTVDVEDEYHRHSIKHSGIA